MCKQSRVSANKEPLLVPLWNKLTVIAHLVEQTTKQIQHATRFSAGCTAVRRGMHKMYAWCEYIRPRWSGSERLLLIASVPREGTTDISELVNLMSATLTLLRCLVRGSLQGVIQLCQK
jgi:hypothetical protein